MPYSPGEEPGKLNREWIPAEYESDGMGGMVKVPGTGIQVDRVTRIEIPNRAPNRPDQRYSLPVAEIISRRGARAVEELAASLAIRSDGGRVEVVSASENRYDVNGPDQDIFCACPDFTRLRESYPDDEIQCKHIIIARLKEAALSPDPLPVGVQWVAEQLGVSFKTVQTACAKGICIATKIKRTWVITEAEASAFIGVYRSKMYDPDFMAYFAEVVASLLSEAPKGEEV